MSLESPDNTLNVRNAVLKVSRVEMNTLSANTVTSDLTVSGNVQVGTANLFVDTVSSNVGVGTNAPMGTLDVKGVLNHTQVANVAQITSNSNVVMEYKLSTRDYETKEPRIALTASSDRGYVVTQSSYAQYNANLGFGWKAFDSTRSSSSSEFSWQTDSSTYSSGNARTGVAVETITENSNTHVGSWVTLETPHKVQVSSVELTCPVGIDEYRPNSVVILGSDNNSTWNFLTGDISSTYTNDIRTITINSTVAYKYHMLLVKTIGSVGAGYATTAFLSDIRYYGTPFTANVATGTDVVLHTTPNVPKLDFSNVYYDGQDYTSMPATVADKSGNGVTGTPSGGVGFDTTYKAFTFDGVDDKITATLTNPAGAWVHSTSMWFKVNSLSAANTLFSIKNNTTADDNKTPHLIINTNGERINYSFWGNDVNFGGYGGIVPNKWYHISTTYSGGSDASSRKMFLNGIELGISLTSSTISVLNVYANSTLKIGVYADGTTNPFNGSIANFRLYNNALSADEIWELYAYQKEYFGVSPDVVTLKAGRVGIGTSEPRAVLDVRGGVIGRGLKFNNKVVVFTTNSTNSSTTMSEAARVYYTPMYCSGSQFQVVCEVTYGWSTAGSSNDWFTVQLLDENDVALDIVYPRYLSGRMINLPKDLIGVITTSSSSPLTFKLVHRRWVADDANTVEQPRFKIYQILI